MPVGFGVQGVCGQTTLAFNFVVILVSKCINNGIVGFKNQTSATVFYLSILNSERTELFLKIRIKETIISIFIYYVSPIYEFTVPISCPDLFGNKQRAVSEKFGLRDEQFGIGEIMW